MSEQPRRRRKLTPEQKRRIRRKRWLKKNGPILAGAAVLVILIVIASLVFIPKKDKSGESASLTATLAPSSEVSDSADAGIEMTGEGEAQGIDVGVGEADNIDEAAATALPADESAAAAVNNSSEPFDYEEAYVRALKGEVTGPAIQPDYSAIDPAYANRWPKTEEGWMPVLYTPENVTEKVICITIDDCYQGENLRTIVQCALDNNSKVTIFPIGANLEVANIASVVKWAWENGMEIENHTYTHHGLYGDDDDGMMTELFKQNLRLNQVLGVNYKEHFFRPYGGNERNCQRMQAAVNQLGFYGVAIWSLSGSRNSIDTLKNSLKPGRVYLFHTTTEHDLEKLVKFIPYAVQQGYKLITLNEMYGLPDNETSALTTTMEDEVPKLKSFKIIPKKMEKGDFSRAITTVQKRLVELGWVEEADGQYGNGSFKGVGCFQLASGIKATGNADVETQRAFYADDAEKGSPSRIQQLIANYKK